MSVKKNTPDFLKHSGLSFTTIINQTMHLIPDDGALGIYCYLASKSENWKICYKHLQNRFNRGRDYIQKKMDLLKKIGLIKKESFRDENGQITHWETSLINFVSHNTENPYCGEVTHSYQNTENPDSGKTSPWKNRHYEIKEDLPIKDNIKIKDSSVYSEKDRFEEFYQAYPRKQARKKAEAAWNKGKINEIADFVITNLIERIKKEYSHKEKTHIPLPATYLNEKRWTDEIIEPAKSTQEKRSPSNNVHNSSKPRQETSYAGVENQSTSWVTPEESMRRDREYQALIQKRCEESIRMITPGATHGCEVKAQTKADIRSANPIDNKSLYPSMRKATEFIPSR